MKILDFIKNRSVKNAGWLISGKLINKLMVFLVSILVARYLGPSNYGLIDYATGYTTFFASLCTLGINSVIIKNFTDHPDEEGESIGTALILRGISSFLSALAIVGIVSVVDKGEPITIAVAALCSLGLVFQIFDTLNYWFQSKLLSKYFAVATIAGSFSVSVYKVLLFVFSKSVLWFAMSTSLDYIVIAVVLFIAYKRKKGPKFSFSVKKAKELLKPGSSFIVSGLMVSIYAVTDRFMLKQMLDQAAVGYYSLAVSISVVWAFVLSAINDSLYPGIVEFYQTNREIYLRRNRRLYAIIFYLSIGMSALIFVVAKPLIGIIYGEEYLPAVAPLRAVVWYTAFSYLGVARNAWVVCEDKQKYLKYLYFGSAVLNVILNLALIPLSGATGAAIASLATQIATITLFPVIIRPLRPNAKLMLDAVLLKDLRERSRR